jgi:folate-dependent phosphoribosylglycinamide formyltransferase PurN
VTLFIVTVDEPVYLNPYVRGVMDECGVTVVGVAIYRPPRKPWTLARLRRSISLALLAALVFSPANLARIVWWRVRALLGFPSGRSLAAICAARGVPCTTLTTANAPEFVATLRSLEVDLLLHQSPEILRGDVLRAPKVGVLNRHLSMLPAYRGAWPVFWQFVNEEPRLGLTIHLVDEGIDTGPVLAQAAIERRPDDTVASAHERLFARAVAVTGEAIARLSRGDAGARPDLAPTIAYRTPSPSEVVAFMLGRRRSPVSARA